MRTLSVLTWNIWFDRFERKARGDAVVKICEDLLPHVICLQEVTPTFLHHSLSLSSTLLANYHCSDSSEMIGDTVRPYGVLTLVRKDLNSSFRWVDLPTQMDRKLLIADLPDWSVSIGNVHLESLDNHPTREAQLSLCAESLQTSSFSLLCGDFNFCSYRNYHNHDHQGQNRLENDSLSQRLPGYGDLWLTLHKAEDDPGYTFDGTVNPLASDPTEQMRYDRILFKQTQHGDLSGLS
eukprot:scaffold3779_cov254-Ochromonas_danica.AAC.6